MRYFQQCILFSIFISEYDVGTAMLSEGGITQKLLIKKTAEKNIVNKKWQANDRCRQESRAEAYGAGKKRSTDNTVVADQSYIGSNKHGIAA